LKTFESILPIYDIPQNTVNISDALRRVQNIILTSADIQENPEWIAFLNKLAEGVFVQAGLSVETVFVHPGSVFALRDLDAPHPQGVLVFGMKPADLCLQGFASLYEVYHWKNYKILFAGPLGQYANNEAAKKTLWAALKIFLVK
jgi:hypothetical protein